MERDETVTGLEAFQERIGIHFEDLSLLLRALTHRSYVNENPLDTLEDNERLEFLGDAVIDVITSELLYHRYPEMPEGRLTSMRAALVRTETLARLAAYLGLGEMLRLGRGEAEHGGRTRPANLCAALEALVGAVYLDRGYEAAAQIIRPHFIPAADAILARELDRDAKSRFQEWSQAALGETPHYETVAAVGPDHEKRFTVRVTVNGEPFGEGTGRSKQSAAQAAAQQALHKVEED
jgi:ribonuclease-3